MTFKYLTVLMISVMLTSVNGRRTRMHRTSTCYCRYSMQRERDDVVNKYNDLTDSFNKLSEFITLNNCPVGHVFDYNSSVINKMSIKCDKCPKNYYRTKHNATCLHCPEGFVSNEGSMICKKRKKEELVDTLYCPKGYVIGSDPYAEYGNSCIKCNSEKKEYMSFNNLEDKCLICESGSIIKNNNCIKCPMGYYELNNKCVECSIGTYNDLKGSINCKKCNNDKSFAYYSIGGTNCDDSYLFSMSNKIAEPIIYSLQSLSGIIYSNRKMIMDTSSTLSVFGGLGIGVYMMIVSP
jgi:hypothetical protein